VAKESQKQPVTGFMGFLRDDKGNNSSMRLMCFFALFAAIYFSYAVLKQLANNDRSKAELLSKKIELLSKEMDRENPNLEGLTSSLNALQESNQSDRESEGMSIIWAFLAAAFGGKFAQKFAEKDSGTTVTPEDSSPP
jgi:uncharacterized protein YlxW (UPF0749 family)